MHQGSFGRQADPGADPWTRRWDKICKENQPWLVMSQPVTVISAGVQIQTSMKFNDWFNDVVYHNL